jgi:hypothetical protein
MSALPPKADRQRNCDLRFVPEADKVIGNHQAFHQPHLYHWLPPPRDIISMLVCTLGGMVTSGNQ